MDPKYICAILNRAVVNCDIIAVVLNFGILRPFYIPAL